MVKEDGQSAPSGDQLAVVTGTFLDYVRTHREKVAMAATGLVLIVAIAVGVNLYSQKADQRASAELQQAMGDFQSQVEKEGREVTLTRFLADSGLGLAPYKGSSSFAGALMWYGSLAYEGADYAKSAAWYGQAASAYGSGTPLRNVAWCAQGQALEQLGKSDDAVVIYEKIRDSGLSMKREEATFLLARLLEVNGQFDEARALYTDVLDDAGEGSVYRAIAQEKVTAAP